MKNGLLSIIISITLISASSYAAENIEKQKLVDDILVSGLIVSPDLNTDGVIAKLGKPKRIEKKPIKNPYYENNDEITHLFYPGIEILVYTTKNLGKDNWSKVSQVIISDKNKQLPHGIKVGITKSDVTSILGKPHSNHETNWYYFPSDDEPHLQLIFKFKNNFVEKVIWSHMP